MEGRRRKAKFSVYEIDVLVDEVYRNRTILFNKPYTQASNERKLNVWKSITKRVNEVCTVRPRTLEEVRKKWYYYWYAMKKEAVKRKDKVQEGSGLLEDLSTPTETKMFEMLDEYDDSSKMVMGEDESEYFVENQRSPSRDVNAEDEKLKRIKSPDSLSINHDHEEFSSDDELSPPVSRPHHKVPSQTPASKESFVKSEPDIRVITVDTEEKSEMSPMVHEVAEHLKSTSEPQLRVLTFSTPQLPVNKVQGKRNKRKRGDLAYQEKEFLRLEKRRLELQEQQLGILKGIQKQMVIDSERNNAFQQEFLEILRKGIKSGQVSAEK
ncbi:myb/SANT-like DNA-binding domain-containing protein 4 [Penaeus indicus]|uniref:myb/SANT-like DNA-binding domain-containing protein 4 n=1 Tax=Penaeus indicus TaxID=29960 RepID=UPI00300CD128